MDDTRQPGLMALAFLLLAGVILGAGCGGKFCEHDRLSTRCGRNGRGTATRTCTDGNWSASSGYSPVADELYLAWAGASASFDVYSTTTFQKLRDIDAAPGLFSWVGGKATSRAGCGSPATVRCCS